jgi:uncharacterized protein YukE
MNEQELQKASEGLANKMKELVGIVNKHTDVLTELEETFRGALKRVYEDLYKKMDTLAALTEAVALRSGISEEELKEIADEIIKENN